MKPRPWPQVRCHRCAMGHARDYGLCEYCRDTTPSLALRLMKLRGILCHLPKRFVTDRAGDTDERANPRDVQRAYDLRMSVGPEIVRAAVFEQMGVER